MTLQSDTVTKFHELLQQQREIALRTMQQAGEQSNALFGHDANIGNFIMAPVVWKSACDRFFTAELLLNCWDQGKDAADSEQKVIALTKRCSSLLSGKEKPGALVEQLSESQLALFRGAAAKLKLAQKETWPQVVTGSSGDPIRLTRRSFGAGLMSGAMAGATAGWAVRQGVNKVVSEPYQISPGLTEGLGATLGVSLYEKWDIKNYRMMTDAEFGHLAKIIGGAYQYLHHSELFDVMGSVNNDLTAATTLFEQLSKQAETLFPPASKEQAIWERFARFYAQTTAGYTRGSQGEVAYRDLATAALGLSEILNANGRGQFKALQEELGMLPSNEKLDAFKQLLSDLSERTGSLAAHATAMGERAWQLSEISAPAR